MAAHLSGFLSGVAIGLGLPRKAGARGRLNPLRRVLHWRPGKTEHLLLVFPAKIFALRKRTLYRHADLSRPTTSSQSCRPRSSRCARSSSISGGRGSRPRAAFFVISIPELWDRTNHNPVRMLQLSRQARLVEVAEDDDFLRELKEVHDAYQEISRRARIPMERQARVRALKKPVAYFSAEFGFHESIPNYSGGLGILSGDHCKSASDLDLKFVAIGLLYRHGYFKQQIDKEGVQEAISLNQNFHHLPIREVRRDNRTLLVSVRILDREVLRENLGAARRPDQSLPARHRHGGEHAGRPPDHGRALRRRSRDADAPGDGARHRRGASALSASGSTRRSST